MMRSMNGFRNFTTRPRGKQGASHKRLAINSQKSERVADYASFHEESGLGEIAENRLQGINRLSTGCICSVFVLCLIMHVMLTNAFGAARNRHPVISALRSIFLTRRESRTWAHAFSGVTDGARG